MGGRPRNRVPEEVCKELTQSRDAIIATNEEVHLFWLLREISTGLAAGGPHLREICQLPTKHGPITLYLTHVCIGLCVDDTHVCIGPCSNDTRHLLGEKNTREGDH